MSIDVCSAHRSQKRESNQLELELQIVVRFHIGSWELKQGPLQEQPVPLTTERSPPAPVHYVSF